MTIDCETTKTPGGNSTDPFSNSGAPAATQRGAAAMLFNTTRLTFGPPSTGAAYRMDEGAAVDRGPGGPRGVLQRLLVIVTG